MLPMTRSLASSRVLLIADRRAERDMPEATPLRRYRLARLAAAAQVTLILWGWLLAQYPYVIPPTLTVTDAASPPATLRAVIVALVAGALLLFPALAYLFGIFKADPASPRPQDDRR